MAHRYSFSQKLGSMLSFLSCLMMLGLTMAHSQTLAPTNSEQVTPFAYAALVFLSELDNKYPFPPPIPPSPPRYGGVLHFPAVVRSFDPTVSYRPELALVWDSLSEWESTWYFPEVQRTPMIRDPKLDAMLDAWRLDPGPGRPSIQKEIWDYLREQVYRLTSIAPPHYRVSQSYLHAGGNPYCWFPGYCSYEAKTAWMSKQTPAKKFDKFAP